MNQQIWSFIRQQLIRVVLLIFAVSVVSFLLLVISPIDPIDAYFSGLSVTEEQKAAMAAFWQFDKPPVERYCIWAADLLQGNWGVSFLYNEPVINVIAEKFQETLLLMMLSWVLAGLVGFFFGIVSGVYEGTWIDKIINGFSLLCVSIPTFWLGIVVLFIFAVELQWFPFALSTPIGKIGADVTWAERLHHVVLPAFTLAVTGVSAITLHTRQKMIDCLGSNYMLFAEARGERLWKRVLRHGLRNVMIPAITLHFASFAELFGGAILTEVVFSYPGLGSAVTLAGLRGDVPLLLGISFFSAIFVFVGNLIANILYAVVNPEIREGGHEI
ncbi:ABC transporter permease [Veillonella sp. VA139]|uniref:ABC transporter permease n=1 Tax=Veillonella sp. VA139 TaxID=741830 RepID=UPI000F8EA066|nr:ABC transporter permease [Veillonella sp. VA139]